MLKNMNAMVFVVLCLFVDRVVCLWFYTKNLLSVDEGAPCFHLHYIFCHFKCTNGF